MKIRIEWDLKEDDLMALALNNGKGKPATYDEVKAWITGLIDSSLQDMRFYYELLKAENVKLRARRIRPGHCRRMHTLRTSEP